tara:strand:- start:141 stop:1436 length:1296 start_codon:yes stop_codon:yes gene_type:complete
MAANTTTRVALLERMSASIGDWQSLTTSGTGNAGGTTLIDTGLVNLAGGGDDDFCLGWYVRITSGNNNGEVRRISIYTQSDTTLTVGQAFSNQVASSVTYELHRYDPVIKLDAITRAAEELFPDLYLSLVDETLVVDDLLSNSDFETFASSAFTNWTAIGSPTLSAETSRVVHGDQSAKLIAAGGAIDALDQNLFTAVNINDVEGKTLHFKGWAWASAASAARLQVTFDGSTYTSGSYHAGDDEWEDPDTMYVSAAIPSGATEMTCRCEVSAGQTVYFDNMFAYIDPVHKYTIPSAIRRGPFRVEQQARISRGTGVFLPLGALMSGHRLKLTGKGMLSRPSTDSGTMEVGEEWAGVITSYALMWMFQSLGTNVSQSLVARFQEQSERWDLATRRLMARLGNGMSSPTVDTWRGYAVEEDSSGRYLVFQETR